MQMRTVFAITLTMFALPAVAAEVPLMPPPRELPASALPVVPADPDLSVCFEVRTVKVPAGFCERAGLKLTGNTVLTDGHLRRFLEAAQSHRDANIMQFPTLTAFDGQEATVKICEDQFFATSIEAMKLKGQTVFIPQNKPIKLGDTLTVCGHVLADMRRVSVRANLTRTSLVGNVELVPIVTQITPVFEGGAQGKPVPVTQFLQVPDVKTDKVEANVIISAGATVVLGSWKEAGDRPARVKGQKKEAPAAEYEVVTFATVRVIRADPAAVAPMPRELPARVTKVFEVFDLVVPGKLAPGQDGSAVFRKNADHLVKVVMQTVRPYSWAESGGRGTVEFFDIGCALVVTNTPDVVSDVGDLLGALRHLKTSDKRAALGERLGLLLPAAPAVAPLPHAAQPFSPQLGYWAAVADGKAAVHKSAVYKLRNVAAADAAHAVNTFLTGKRLSAQVVAEPVSNEVCVAAEPALQKQIGDMLAALDKAPVQVIVQAMVIQVPRGFAAEAGLEGGGNAWTLSPRETKMLTGLIRAAKGRGELDVLARPTVQVTDNQTGFVQVGQDFPVVTAAGGEAKAGAVAPAAVVSFVQSGITFRVTPTVSADGKSVRLASKTQVTAEATRVVLAGAVGRLPVFNTVDVSSTAEVRTGETLVVATSGEKYETLVVITPVVTAPMPEVVRPAGGFPK